MVIFHSRVIAVLVGVISGSLSTADELHKSSNKIVSTIHRGVKEEMNFIRLSHDGVTLDIDRDVSTTILLVFIMP